MAVIDGKWLSKEGLAYFWSKIKSIFTKQTETNVIANLGAKNLLNFDVCSAASTGGVSYTVNADGTVTVNGTPQGTGPSYVQLMLRNDAVRVDDFCDGSHILSGCPNGGSDSRYRLYVAKGSYSRFDYGNGVLLTKTTLTDIRVVIYIAKGYTANNLVFKPMIRPVEITDGTFEPYAPTNRELYETRFGSKVILRDNVDLNHIKTGGIYNGVNSTGNSAVHMPVATGSFNFVLTVIEANEFIIQIFKQLNSAGDPNLYIRKFYIYNSDWDNWYQFTGTQV